LDEVGKSPKDGEVLRQDEGLLVIEAGDDISKVQPLKELAARFVLGEIQGIGNDEVRAALAGDNQAHQWDGF
jgi:hypothetical protein